VQKIQSYLIEPLTTTTEEAIRTGNNYSALSKELQDLSVDTDTLIKSEETYQSLFGTLQKNNEEIEKIPSFAEAIAQLKKQLDNLQKEVTEQIKHIDKLTSDCSELRKKTTNPKLLKELDDDIGYLNHKRVQTNDLLVSIQSERTALQSVQTGEPDLAKQERLSEMLDNIEEFGISLLGDLGEIDDEVEVVIAGELESIEAMIKKQEAARNAEASTDSIDESSAEIDKMMQDLDSINIPTPESKMADLVKKASDDLSALETSIDTHLAAIDETERELTRAIAEGKNPTESDYKPQQIFIAAEKKHFSKTKIQYKAAVDKLIELQAEGKTITDSTVTKIVETLARAYATTGERITTNKARLDQITAYSQTLSPIASAPAAPAPAAPAAPAPAAPAPAAPAAAAPAAPKRIDDIISELNANIVTAQQQLGALGETIAKQQAIAYPTRGTLSKHKLNELANSTLNILKKPFDNSIPDALKPFETSITEIQRELQSDPINLPAIQRNLEQTQKQLLQTLASQIEVRKNTLTALQAESTTLADKKTGGTPLTTAEENRLREIATDIEKAISTESSIAKLTAQLPSLYTDSIVREHVIKLANGSLRDLSLLAEEIVTLAEGNQEISQTLSAAIESLQNIKKTRAGRENTSSIIESINQQLDALIANTEPAELRNQLTRFKENVTALQSHLSAFQHFGVSVGQAVKAETITLSKDKTYEQVVREEQARFTPAAADGALAVLESEQPETLHEKAQNETVIKKSFGGAVWLESAQSDSLKSELVKLPEKVDPRMILTKVFMDVEDERFRFSAQTAVNVMNSLRQKHKELTVENVAAQLMGQVLTSTINPEHTVPVTDENKKALAEHFVTAYKANATIDTKAGKLPSIELLSLAMTQIMNHLANSNSPAMYLTHAAYREVAEAYVYAGKLIGVQVINHSQYSVDEKAFHEKTGMFKPSKEGVLTDLIRKNPALLDVAQKAQALVQEISARREALRGPAP
jgi:hypothetical protein